VLHVWLASEPWEVVRDRSLTDDTHAAVGRRTLNNCVLESRTGIADAPHSEPETDRFGVTRRAQRTLHWHDRTFADDGLSALCP
jgi:hypothetical protein